MRVVVWWCIPCKGILPIFEAFGNNYGEVRFVVEQMNSLARQNLGWQPMTSRIFSIETLERDDWRSYVSHILEEETGSIHIMNGIGVFPKLKYVLKILVDKRLKYGFLAEAPHNPYRGILRVLKYCYTNHFKRFLNKKYIECADFYFSASGDKSKILQKIGWSQDKIFPYGYFTEYIDYPIREKSNNNKIKLLCTGYITKNKGHIILLKALKELGGKANNFELNITGYGPEKEKLIKYISRNKLNMVNLLGVVNNEELKNLMTNSDVLVATGFEEPWGIRINEAIMYELYIISSNGIGASEMVKDLNTGFVFEKEDHIGLALALQKVIKEKDSIFKIDWENSKKRISPKSAAKYLFKSLQSIYDKKQFQKLKPWEYQ